MQSRIAGSPLGVIARLAGQPPKYLERADHVSKAPDIAVIGLLLGLCSMLSKHQRNAPTLKVLGRKRHTDEIASVRG